jgi:hypothetical protein
VDIPSATRRETMHLRGWIGEEARRLLPQTKFDPRYVTATYGLYTVQAEGGASTSEMALSRRGIMSTGTREPNHADSSSGILPLSSNQPTLHLWAAVLWDHCGQDVVEVAEEMGLSNRRR